MDFLKRLFGSATDSGSSAQAARRRLLEVVVHDRAELPPGIVELIRDDIVNVVSRRIKIDRDQVTVNVNNMGAKSIVEIDVPLINDQSREGGRVHGTAKRTGRRTNH